MVEIHPLFALAPHGDNDLRRTGINQYRRAHNNLLKHNRIRRPNAPTPDRSPSSCLHGLARQADGTQNILFEPGASAAQETT